MKAAAVKHVRATGRGPYSVTALRLEGTEYVAACDPVTVPDRVTMMRVARTAYDATGIVPDVRDSGGAYALSNEEVGNWGLA